MKQSAVELGKTYMAKVSGGVVPVRITQEKWIGEKMAGWVGVNTQTNRSVRVKSAQRLRGEAGGAAADSGARTKPAGKAGAPIALSDEVGVAVDRRMTAGAIPEMEREAARMNAARAAGSPRPPTKPKPKGGKSSSAPKEKAAKAAKPKAAKPPKVKRVSGLDAAAQVLAQARKPMNCSQVMEAIREKGLWKSGGKTPEATLYAAIIREIADKGKESRFKKIERGLFVAAPHAAAAGKGG